MASGSQDKKFILWDTSTGRMMHTLVHLHPVYRILFAPNEKLLACEGCGRVRFWNPATGVLLGEYEIHGSIISFSSGSEKLITTLGQIDVQSICPSISASMESLGSQEIFVETCWWLRELIRSFCSLMTTGELLLLLETTFWLLDLIPAVYLSLNSSSPKSTLFSCP